MIGYFLRRRRVFYRARVDGRTRWHEAAPWIALGVVALMVFVTLVAEAAWR